MSEVQFDFTEEEKEINAHLLTYWEEMKLNEIRGNLERCWDLDKKN
jgi:hypothetical protein